MHDQDCQQVDAATLPGAWIRSLPGCDRYVRVDGLASIAFGGNNGVERPIEWWDDMWIVSMVGHSVGPIATAGSVGGLASLKLRVTLNGEVALVTTQTQGKADFVSLFGLHGPAHLPCPIMRYVEQREKWFVTFRNDSSDTNLIPELTFGVRRFLTPEEYEAWRPFIAAQDLTAQQRAAMMKKGINRGR